MQNLKLLTVSVFFFALACERVFIETHSIESRCYRTGKYTVCRCTCASFSLEILQAGAVKGLISLLYPKIHFRAQEYQESLRSIWQIIYGAPSRKSPECLQRLQMWTVVTATNTLIWYNTQAHLSMQLNECMQTPPSPHLSTHTHTCTHSHMCTHSHTHTHTHTLKYMHYYYNTSDG